MRFDELKTKEFEEMQRAKAMEKQTAWNQLKAEARNDAEVLHALAKAFGKLEID